MRRFEAVLSAAFILAPALAGCARQTTISDDGALGSTTDPVQIQYLNAGYGTVVIGTSAKTACTGAIRFQWTDGTHGNCGATFISPHYAVTAAHCVPKDQLSLSSTFTVSQYDTTGLTSTAITNQSVIAGTTWSNYKHNTTLSASDGYRVTPYTDCKVVRRCSIDGTDTENDFGRDNCPFTDNVDIALIKCASRPASATWAAVATSESGAQQVEVWWFHEVVYLATSASEGLLLGPTDSWAHYGSLGSVTSNYHYEHGASEADQQLLPIFSGTWPDGTPYKALGFDNPDQTTKTNVPLCHGSSGSGVFPRGDSAYLGPVDEGGTLDVGRLCTDMVAANASRNTSNMEYIQAQWSRKLEAVSEVTADRPH